jgi:hypothetical protein
MQQKGRDAALSRRPCLTRKSQQTHQGRGAKLAPYSSEYFQKALNIPFGGFGWFKAFCTCSIVNSCVQSHSGQSAATTLPGGKSPSSNDSTASQLGHLTFNCFFIATLFSFLVDDGPCARCECCDDTWKSSDQQGPNRPETFRAFFAGRPRVFGRFTVLIQTLQSLRFDDCRPLVTASLAG